MTSKGPSRHPKKKKSVHQKKAGTSAPVSELLSGLRHQMDSRWPNLGRRLAAVIRISRERLDDIYCSAAQFVTEHKEAFDDRRAEEKAHERAAGSTTPPPGAVLHPVRASGNPAIKGTVTRSVRPPSVKKPKKSQQNSLLET